MNTSRRTTHNGSPQLDLASFLVRDQDRAAQRRMLAYRAAINTTGKMPLMNRDAYAYALNVGGIGV